MSSKLAGPTLRHHFGVEAKRLLIEVMETLPGPSKKTRIATIAVEFKMPFDTVLNVDKGKCGWRAFLRFHQGYLAWKAKRENETTNAEIIDRLQRVENSLVRLAEIISTADGGVPDVHRAPMRSHSMVRSPA